MCVLLTVPDRSLINECNCILLINDGEIGISLHRWCTIFKPRIGIHHHWGVMV